MSRTSENTSFICENCGALVPKHNYGSFRNHCQRCLFSKHLDINPGDRLSDCHGLMKPIGIKKHKKKGYQLIHKCLDCGYTTTNKVDDLQDNFDLIIELTSNIK